MASTTGDSSAAIPQGAVEQAEQAVAYAMGLLAEMGRVELVDGKLQAGGEVLNDTTKLVDAVKDRYGFGCTIFQSNVRVSTTAVAAGGTARALGTSTNEMVTHRVYRNGERFRGITRTIGKDWVIIYIPLRDHAGRIVGMLAVFRELADFLDDLPLLDGTAEAVILCTESGRVCDANRAACDMLGLSRPELLALSMQDFTVASSKDEPTALPPPPQLGSEPIELERFWRRTGGFEFPVELAIERMDRSGEDSILVIARDFTEKYEARAQLREANVKLARRGESLEEEVGIRTRELKIARDAALDANRAKSAFLANMSHELRTPLNAILGYSEMLLEDAQADGNEMVTKDLSRIRSAGRHLQQLIGDILDLSKIEAGHVTLFHEDIDMADLLRSVGDTVAPLAKANSDRFVVEYPEEILGFRADLTPVRQILLNLLSNAFKFTEKGTVTLTIRRHGSDKPMISFVVSDDGIGMTANQESRIFQAFLQADDSTTREYGGTGLGLTITKRFTEMMGGVVTCASEAGVGTTFEVRLPLRPVEDSAHLGAKSAGTSVAVIADGETVIVIDDDPAVRDLLTSTLTKADFRVTAVSSGPEGLELAKEMRPLAITLDVMMPEMDGWEVLTKLKADPETRDIPVILVTILDERKLGFTLGAHDFMTKPVDHRHLVRVLRGLGTGASSVLVVEDDPAARELTVRNLRADGWDPVEAENGRVGLERLRQHTPDVIVLDLMMPVMDGFEFLDALRAQERWRNLPVIVLTARDLSTQERELLSGRVQQTLQKGSAAGHELLQRLRELLMRKRSIVPPGDGDRGGQ